MIGPVDTPPAGAATATPAQNAPLPASVALELAHAVIRYAAQQADARVIVVKGLAAARLGLRPIWAGADVDVLVEPAAFERVVEVLRGSGWHPRPADDDALAFPPHSVSLTHENWSCDLDVHFRFPGFERPDDEVFEQLWAHREDAEAAGSAIAVTDEIDTLLTLALHDLRNPRVRRHRDDLMRLARYAQRLEPDALVARARELGALACARPFLEPLVPVGRSLKTAWGAPSRSWQLRTLDPLARRLVLIVDGAYWRNGVPLRRLLAPPRTTLVKEGLPHERPTPPQLARAYVRRWLRGIRLAPAALWNAARFLAGRRG